MVRRFSILLFFAWLPCHATTVLITAFDPYDGRSFNGTKIIAEALQKLYSNQEVIVDVCVLPVIYDAAPKKVEECIATSKRLPDLVISLGEQGYNDVRLETHFLNKDDSPTRDNEGTVRSGTPILKGEAENFVSTLPVSRMACAGREIRKDTDGSTEMSRYVCNNTAYLLAHYFGNSKTPYGLIHVPQYHSEDLDLETDITLQAVSKMLDVALQAVLDKTAYTPQPLTRTEIEQFVAERSETLSSCELEYYHRLVPRE